MTLSIAFLIAHINNLNDLPIGMHSWAQSDRYAIALNYLNEDNIFTPKTNALYTEEGKVGVEFSGIAYVSAKIAVLLKSENHLPFIFKCLQLFLLVLLLSLFLTTIYNYNAVNSLINFLLWFASPLLLYYGFNFIPDSLGLGFAICSLGYYYEYYKKGESNYLLLAVVLGCFGGLSKLPVLIYPIAFLTHQAFLKLKAKKMERLEIVLLLSGFFMVLGVLIYDYVFLIDANNRLWSVIFMGKPNPILNFNDLTNALKGISFWRFEFFNLFQFMALVILMAFLIYKVKLIPVFFKELSVIVLIGLLFYFIGLGKQLIHHDYYFLSSFLPFILFAATLQTKQLLYLTKNKYKVALLIVSIAVSFNSFNQAEARQHEYYTIRDNTLDNNLLWLKNGDQKLSEAGVGKNEVIFVLYDFAPNTSLVYFNRKGLVFNHEQMSRKEPHIEFWLEKLKPNYLVVKADWEVDFFRDKPEMARTWTRIPQDGFILYKRP